MKALRIAGIAVGVLLLVSVAAGAYLLGREEVPAETTYRIDLGELRRLAASLPGERPLRINHELVARAFLPRVALFAGESFDPHPMIHGAYQIVYPDGFVVVDAVMTKELFQRDMGGEANAYDEEGFATVRDALERARAVVVTHEHPDHLDGIASHPRPDRIAPRVRLNPEQLADPTIDDALRDAVGVLAYDDATALAPGVALLRAAGHTPGSQIVYVALQDGSEWLLLGDVAWHMRQIRELHYRPRLVTDLFLGEDRDAVLGQFRALFDLMETHPDVLQVASHDEDQRAELVRSGRLGDGFE